MRNRLVYQPAYIGRAAHIYEANQYNIEELLQNALRAEVGEITLTIDVPAYATTGKSMNVCYAAVLPVSTGFRVAQVDDLNVYEKYAAPTWEAACAWLVANKKSLPRSRKWHIYGLGGPLYSGGANLLTWEYALCRRSTETPPVQVVRHNPPPPADLYGLPKLPRFP